MEKRGDKGKLRTRSGEFGLEWGSGGDEVSEVGKPDNSGELTRKWGSKLGKRGGETATKLRVWGERFRHEEARMGKEDERAWW